MTSIAHLSHRIEPLSPRHQINDIGELFLDEKYSRLLSLPVVDGGKPVGVISRNDIQRIFTSRFGREIQGKKKVADFMNPSPLLVTIGQSMEEASRFVTQNISFPIAEDFILVDGGKYHGVGSVIDLLRGMEKRILAQNNSLSSALDQLKASQAQLVQSEKMASLGQMVAGVAHEINTPLGYVKNNLEMAGEAFGRFQELIESYRRLFALLQSNDADEADIRNNLFDLKKIQEELEAVYPREDMSALFSDTEYGLRQISEIVVNLKNFSRLDLAPVDDVDINQCIDSALLIAKNVIKHKAEVTRNFGELPKVSCAPSQINQVILNLVTNAAHAIEHTEGRITIRTQADRDNVFIIITDNGKGIAAENLGKIFDPFFTTKPVGQGTGLGLSIAFRIIQDHCGNIQVKSVPGRGTAFCIRLPIKGAGPLGITA